MLNGVYGGTKAFVLAFSQSLRHELEGKGVRVQVVLPGATLTDFWNVAGLPAHNLPSEILMPVGTMVDAALAGLDLGEFATIPSLPDAADWDAFEAARQKLLLNLSHAHPAARYRKQSNRQQLPFARREFRQATSMKAAKTAKHLGFRTKPEDVTRS